MADLSARNCLLLKELLESSSDSEDDELLLTCLGRSSPTYKPKIQGYVVDVVHNYSDFEFKKNFRLQRLTCYQVIDDFERSQHFPKDETHGGSQPISAETHILSFLWFSGNKSCIRDVAGRFGIGESTFHRLMHRVLNYLLAIAPNIIKFPNTEEEKRNSAAEFQKISGFPNVIGCIDGSYIPIRTPAHKIKSTYINRHDGTSLTLQGICDAERKFLDVFTGVPSKIHDSTVLKLSFINEDIQQICSRQWHLIGDAAYPLREWLLTPFRDYGNLNDNQKRYNFKLSATRVLIENAFGILKSRFRQLTRTDFHSVDTTSKFIIGCCVLHNLCINHQDLWEEEQENPIYEAMEPNNNNDARENILRLLGETKRNNLCETL